jgi:flagellar basal-body rod protein FlgF
MDRMIHTVMNSITNMQEKRTISAQNLANQHVPGFRRDLPTDGETRFVAELDSLNARAFQTTRAAAQFSDAQGFLDSTGNPYDIAIAEEGYFYAQREGGEPGLSRRGDLRVGPDGMLRDGGGQMVLNADLEPIIVPPNQGLQVTEVGQIFIEPLGAQPGERVEVAVIATMIPPEGMRLEKNLDGLIRPAEAEMPAPDQAAKILQGTLEGSNVNATEELIASIEMQREFELNIKLIAQAKELDEAGASLMRLPG